MIELMNGEEVSPDLSCDTDIQNPVCPDILYNDRIFESYAEVQELVNQIGKRSFTLVSIRGSNLNHAPNLDKEKFKYKSVHFICIHHPHGHASRNRDLRPNQRYFNLNCPFQFKIVLDIAKKLYRVTNLRNTHKNHPLSQESFIRYPRNRRLSDEERKKYIGRDILELKAKKSDLKRVIQKETGKVTTTKDLGNQTAKEKNARDSNSLIKNELDLCIEILEAEKGADPDSTLRVIADESGVVTCLFWQNSYMKEIFNKFSSLVFMDGTYKLTQCGYVMITVLVMDETKSNCLVAWALVPSESKANYKSVLQCLKDSSGEQAVSKIETMITDKDFAEISAIHEVFPNVAIVNCRFHVLKAVTRHLDNLHFGNEQHLRKTIKDLFYRMVYESTEDGYMDAWEQICCLEGTVDALGEAKGYLERNWHAQRETFANHVLKKTALFSQYTNNFAETCNKLIKDKIQSRSKLDFVAQEMLYLSKEQKERKTQKDWEHQCKSFKPTNADGSDVYLKEVLAFSRNLIDVAVIKDIIGQYKKLETISDDELNFLPGQHSCTRTANPCSFYTSNLLPCRHLLFVRKQNGEEILSRSMFANRWLKDQPSCSSQLFLAPLGKKRGKCSGHTNKFQSYHKNKKRNEKNTRNIIEDQSTSEPCSQEQKTLVSDLNSGFQQKGLSLEMCQKDLNTLISPNVSGTDLWYNDRHVNACHALIKKKFPHLEGLQDIVLARFSGYSPINPARDFIQVMSSGGDHWVCATNIGVPDSNREYEAILYDSWIRFEPGSKNDMVPTPSVTSALCQLLSKTEGGQQFLNVRILPCQQQTNGVDCGALAIANLMTLAFGKQPQNVKYTSDLRLNFFDMIEKVEARMFDNIQYDQSQSKRMCHIGGISRLVNLPKEMRYSIQRICHCGNPATYGNVAFCDGCKKPFHQSCFLIGQDVLKEQWDFLCYHCRVPGEYPIPINHEDIQEVTDEIKKLSSNTHVMKNLVKKATKRSDKLILPSTTEQFERVETIIAEYDLHQVCHRKGILYHTLYNVCSNSVEAGTIRSHYLEDMNVAQMVHFFILLICEIKQYDCQPLFSKADSSKTNTRKSAEEINTIIDENHKWFREMRNSFSSVQKKSKMFCNRVIPYEKSLDRYSDLRNDLEFITCQLNSSVALMKKLNTGLSECAKKKILSMIKGMEDLKSQIQSEALQLKRHQAEKSKNLH